MKKNNMKFKIVFFEILNFCIWLYINPSLAKYEETKSKLRLSIIATKKVKNKKITKSFFFSKNNKLEINFFTKK